MSFQPMQNPVDLVQTVIVIVLIVGIMITFAVRNFLKDKKRRSQALQAAVFMIVLVVAIVVPWNYLFAAWLGYEVFN